MKKPIKIIYIILIIVLVLAITISLAILFYNKVVKKDNKEETPEPTIDPQTIEWDQSGRLDVDLSLSEDSYLDGKVSININGLNVEIGGTNTGNGVSILPSVNTDKYYAIICANAQAYIESNFGEYYNILNYDKNCHLYIKDTQDFEFKKLTELYWSSDILYDLDEDEILLRFYNIETNNIDFILKVIIKRNTDNKYYIDSVIDANEFENNHLEIINNAIQNTYVTRLKELDTNVDIIETTTYGLCFYKTQSLTKIGYVNALDLGLDKFPLRMFTLNYNNSLYNIYLDKNNDIVCYDAIYPNDIIIYALRNNPEYIDEYKDLAIMYELIPNGEYQPLPETEVKPTYTPDPESIKSEWEYMQEQIRKNQEEAEKEQQEQGGEIGDAEVP